MAKKKEISLDDQLERVKRYLIGIWLFREPNKKPKWCGTFAYRGHYYDVSGRKDAMSAAKAVEKAVKDLARKKKKRKR